MPPDRLGDGLQKIGGEFGDEKDADQMEDVHHALLLPILIADDFIVHFGDDRFGDLGDVQHIDLVQARIIDAQLPNRLEFRLFGIQTH